MNKKRTGVRFIETNTRLLFTGNLLLLGFI